MTFNMATMAADESRTNNSERAYFKFLMQVGDLMGKFIDLGTQEESDAFDLYSDGCSAQEAADEMKAWAGTSKQ